ncbi:unnamed protein product [Litomosoides sigmodontis]|uniref:Uncharacterized protein n=1 Tax=Litomosoides sigmodontis TaxID=42156 RepID=A0A3P6SRZ7_LITSI|nr:unnamed protein product [Litomosoides sigmodontis]
MIQSQANFTVDRDGPEKGERAVYKLWCCQCTKNEIDDLARISNNNNRDGGDSSLSNGVVVTRQPLPNNENNCSHNDLSFCSSVSGIKNDFNEQAHGLNDDSEMKKKMKRLKEESSKITSAILDSLISESNKVRLEEELTRSDQEEMKKFPTKQDSVRDMKDIALSDFDDPWESISDNEQVTRIGGHSNHSFDPIADQDGKEEFDERNDDDVSDACSNSVRTSQLESFQVNSSQMRESDARLNGIEFLNHTVKAVNNSAASCGTFSKSVNSLTSSSNQKRSTCIDNEDEYHSVTCIPSDDLAMKKENSQNRNISVEIDVAVSEHKTKAFVVRSNKMYTNDVSSSSSSDNDDTPEVIASIKNPERTPRISRQCITNVADESARNDDSKLIIKHENASKNTDNAQVFIDDILSERFI